MDIITVLDAQGIIRFENPATEHLLGYHPDELFGRFAFDLIHPEDRPAALKAFQGVLARPDQTASAEFRFQTKDGSWRYLSAVAKNLLHEPGDCRRDYQLCATSREQKQAETAPRAVLRNGSGSWRKTSTMVFWVCDASITTMYYISPAYEMIWGRTCESVMKSPRSFLDAVHPDDREKFLASLAEIELGRPQSSVYRITRPDGERAMDFRTRIPGV